MSKTEPFHPDTDLQRVPEVKEGYAISIGPVRWKEYKPDGQRQMKRKGRWQAMTEYGGWGNCETPSEVWQEFPDYRAMRTRAEVAEEDALCAKDTLKAWFDRRALAHEAVDEAVLSAARAYLRTSRSGGMDKATSDMIEGVIADMARLSVFADLFARAMRTRTEAADGHGT